MITLTREEAQQVMNALCIAVEPKKGKVYAFDFQPVECSSMHEKAIEALRARLSAPEPEPVAWFMENTFMDGTPSFIQVCETDPEFYTPLYRAPQPEPKDDGYCQACEENHCTAKTGCVAISNLPQREWQGLTVDEFYDLDDVGRKMILEYGRLVEAKIKEKNYDKR